ncbi:MAG TPA: AAA family ATPase, partial [Chloroflexota bacterium]|nr:AAA family ATPase [Chloroflexota bacterium]
GRKVDFRNTIIVMTSNVGSDLLKRDATLGFAMTKDEAKTDEDNYQKLKDKVLTEMKKIFRPEFLNRLDATIVFRSLTREQIREIVDLLLTRVRAQLTEQQLKLEVPDDAKDFLALKGWDPQFGARPLRRVIQNMIEDPLSEGLLEGKYKPNDTIVATVVDGALTLEVVETLVTV